MLFRKIFSCTVLTLYSGLWLGSLRRCVLGNNLILYGYYVILVATAMSPISTLSSEPIVVHHVTKSSMKISTWCNIWPLAKKKLIMFFLRMCIYCKKHCLANQTPSISFNSMIKSSLRTWQCLILNQFVCRKTKSATSILQLGLASSFQKMYHFCQLDWTTNVFMQFQSRSFGWVVSWCSQCVSNREQNATEIKVFGDWD